MTASALFAGAVAHHRFAPRDHRLAYPAFQLLLDLEERDALARRLRLFSVGRFNLFSHDDRDHGEGQPGALRNWVATRLAESGLGSELGRIQLLAMPRILGFVFNPLSIYYCHDTDDHLVAVIHEVHNTFGERHAYVLAADPTGGRVTQSCAKTFRVSPFMPLGLIYDFDLRLSDKAVRAAIDVRNPDGSLLLSTVFTGQRRPLTDRNLLAIFFQFPLMTLKVVAAIHFEAFKLWWKGVPPSAESLPPRPQRGRLPRGRRPPFPTPSSPAPPTARSPG